MADIYLKCKLCSINFTEPDTVSHLTYACPNLRCTCISYADVEYDGYAECFRCQFYNKCPDIGAAFCCSNCGSNAWDQVAAPPMGGLGHVGSPGPIGVNGPGPCPSGPNGAMGVSGNSNTTNGPPNSVIPLPPQGRMTYPKQRGTNSPYWKFVDEEEKPVKNPFLTKNKRDW